MNPQHNLVVTMNYRSIQRNADHGCFTLSCNFMANQSVAGNEGKTRNEICVSFYVFHFL